MCPFCYQKGGSLLHCLSTLTIINMAVYFCCTGLGVASTGRYPASYPMKPGLSSPVKMTAAITYPTYILSFFISFLLLYYDNSKNSTLNTANGLAIIYRNYTLKQLPPTNSLTIELLGRSSLLTAKKYSKNFNSRLASKYSGSSVPIPNNNGSACIFNIANS